MDNLSFGQLLEATREDLFDECEWRGLRLTRNPSKFEAVKLIHADNVQNQKERQFERQSRDVEIRTQKVALTEQTESTKAQPRIQASHPASFSVSDVLQIARIVTTTDLSFFRVGPERNMLAGSTPLRPYVSNINVATTLFLPLQRVICVDQPTTGTGTAVQRLLPGEYGRRN